MSSPEKLRGRVCRVGYAFNKKKLRNSAISSTVHVAQEVSSSIIGDVVSNTGGWFGGGLASIVGLTGEESILEGVQFFPFEEDGIYDVIIHKLTQDIDQKSSSSVEKIRVLTEYLLNHPETTIVDPIENVRNVLDRYRTLQCLRTTRDRLLLAKGECPFSVPIGVVIDKPNIDIKDLTENVGMSFPVICKPLVACGIPDSHSLEIVMSSKGLVQVQVQMPYLMQKYHDHDDIFYKVYVIGDDVMASSRRSLPNLSDVQIKADLQSKDIHSISFDSRLPFPTLNHGVLKVDLVSDDDNNDGFSHKMITLSLHTRLKEIAVEIGSELGLSLFGFDVISAKDGQLYVIDVNFFPSYKDVHDFPSRLRAHLRDKASMTKWEEP
jgi:hypothetical protein